MQLRSTLLTLLIVAFAATSTSATVPRSDEEHKFIKRSPRRHGMASTIAGGTVLAGTGAFAATAGGMAAHKLFGDGHDHERSSESENGARMVPQPVYAPVYPAPQPQYAASAGGNVGTGGGGSSASGPAFPIGILMSNGDTVPIPKGLLQQAQYAGQGGQQVGNGGGIVFPGGNN